MADLSNLSVLLTGAAGGIGVAMAEAFAAAGARLALVDLNAPTELAARLGSEHRAYQIDLSDPTAVQSEVPRIGQEMGIDIVINNAGLGIVFPADQMNVEDWDNTFAVNLRGPCKRAYMDIILIRVGRMRQHRTQPHLRAYHSGSRQRVQI